MRTTFQTAMNKSANRAHKRRRPRASLLLAMVLTTSPAFAAVPEPDAVLYGGITLDEAPVTAARTDVVVEARRTSNGPVLARYRLGSNAGAGDFYTLSIPLESGAATGSTAAARAGETLVIVVTDSSGVRAESGYTIASRGEVKRLDFGTVGVDADGNGLPDLWEVTHFGANEQDPDAINLNGRTTRENFVTGTDPNDEEGRFELVASRDGDVTTVSFLARRAEGPGYDGFNRFYTLESTTMLGEAPWLPVSNFVDVPGDDQPVTLQTEPENAPTYYRARVRLDAP